MGMGTRRAVIFGRVCGGCKIHDPCYEAGPPVPPQDKLTTMTVCTSSVHSDAFDEYVQGLTELPVFYFRAAEILAIWEWFYYEEL